MLLPPEFRVVGGGGGIVCSLRTFTSPRVKRREKQEAWLQSREGRALVERHSEFAGQERNLRDKWVDIPGRQRPHLPCMHAELCCPHFPQGKLSTTRKCKD